VRPCNAQPKYDGITADGIAAQDERESIYLRDGGRCQTCHKLIAFDAFTLAHHIANTKANRLRWGNDVIDSPLNKCVTCPGACNDKQNIGGRPIACAVLAAQISGMKSTTSWPRSER